jgi:hypothetical protein
MLCHIRLGSRGYYSFIATNLTARGLNYKKDKPSIRYFNIKSLFSFIALITPQQYSTVTTPIQQLLPLCADLQQQRSHRSWLKKAAMLTLYGARIELESSESPL